MKKNIFNYIIAFILPILIFCFALYSMNVYPFGNISIRISDAIAQYPGFFEGLKNFNIFTFNLGLGENFYPIFTTYLNNPLNLLYFLFKKENFDLFYIILILIKFGLMGLTMNILLNYKKIYNKKSIIFSTVYALSGFTTFYYWNYQFLDAVYMLPIIMIGIDKIVNDNKNLMYYLTLTYMIIIHYYTAYMICLFSVIYFFFLLYNGNLKKEEKKKRTINFFVTSLFCGLSSAFILIPTIFSLFQGRTSYLNNLNFWGINKVAIGSLYNFTMGSNFIKELINLVNSSSLYISMFVFILIIVSIFNSNMNKKLKKSISVVIVIYFLSIFLNPLYYMWHLFQQPVGIPSRFIFCFNAFLILMAYNFFIKKEFHNNRISKKLIIIVLFSIILFFGLKYYYYVYSNNKNNILLVSLDHIYIWLLILSLIIILYYFITYNKEKLIYITYFIIIVELCVNTIMNINVNFQLGYYQNINVNDNKQYILKTENIINDLKKQEQNFVRMHNTLYKNNGLIYNFYSISRYASIYNSNLPTFLENFRDDNEHGHSTRYLSHFLMDALLGVKYIINDNDYSVLTNKYIINSLGFLTANENIVNLEDTNIVTIFNELVNNEYDLELNYLSPEKELININEEDGWYSLNNIEENGKVVLTYNINENIIGKINFLYNYVLYKTDENNNIESILKYDDTYKLFLNNQKVDNIYNLKKGDVVKVEILLNKDNDSTPKFKEELEYVNEEKFKSLINYLNLNTIKDIKINSDGFEGNFLASNEKKTLILTIPYDNNMEFLIDGKITNYQKCLNGIICIANINEGNHFLRMKYQVKGLKIGFIISSFSILSFILFKVFNIKMSNIKKKIKLVDNYK